MPGQNDAWSGRLPGHIVIARDCPQLLTEMPQHDRAIGTARHNVAVGEQGALGAGQTRDHIAVAVNHLPDLGWKKFRFFVYFI